MEDRNLLVSDCIVVCCCCECMILQILLFVLLKLPSKALKKTKQYARKLRTRKKGTKKNIMKIELRRSSDSFRSSTCIRVASFRIEVEEFFLDESLGIGCCNEEVERVMEDLSRKGEFGFGSFWGGDDIASPSRSFRSSCVEEEEIDYGVVQCRLIELFGSIDFHEQC